MRDDQGVNVRRGLGSLGGQEVISRHGPIRIPAEYAPREDHWPEGSTAAECTKNKKKRMIGPEVCAPRAASWEEAGRSEAGGRHLEGWTL